MKGIKDKADQYNLKWAPLFLLLFFVQCTQNQDCAQKKPNEAYLPAIRCEADFALLKGTPLSTQYAQVDAVKLDRGSRNIYVKQARPY